MLGEAQERLEMGQWGREGVKVLHEVELGHLKQGEAAGQLGLSEGGFRRGLKRDRAKGGRGVARGLRGRAWNRRIEEEEVARAAVRVVKKGYSDLGPRPGSECLEGEQGIRVRRERLRKLLTAAGRSGTGVCMPGWRSEGRRRCAWQRLERYGRPEAVYTDRASAAGAGDRVDCGAVAEFLPMRNQRFVRAPASAVDAHRSLLSTDLASVGRFRSRRLGRDREPAAKVKRPVKRSIPPPGQSHWMKGFRVEGNPAWKAWREEQAAAVSARLRSPSGLPSPG